MRSHCSREGPKSSLSGILIRGEEMQKQTQEEDDVNADAQGNACDSRGTDWKGAAESQDPLD